MSNIPACCCAYRSACSHGLALMNKAADATPLTTKARIKPRLPPVKKTPERHVNATRNNSVATPCVEFDPTISSLGLRHTNDGTLVSACGFTARQGPTAHFRATTISLKELGFVARSSTARSPDNPMFRQKRRTISPVQHSCLRRARSGSAPPRRTKLHGAELADRALHVESPV